MTDRASGTKWFAVVNIYAASRKAGGRWKQVKQLLENERVAYDYELTGKVGNAKSITAQACIKGYRKFLAVGGDGTIHDVFNAIMSYVSDSGVPSSDFTLGVIPMGSGNDWIKTLGIKNNLNSAVNAIIAGNTSRQDIVKVSLLEPISTEEKPVFVSYMVNVGGVGVDANVCNIVNHRKKHGERGKILYIKALLMSLRRRRPAHVHVLADGKIVYTGDFISIAFGSGKYSGGGLRQTPEAEIDDGFVDMTIVPNVSLWRMALEIYKLFTGKFLTIPELIATKSKSIYVYPQSHADSLVEVDGEIIGRAPLKVEVSGDWINVIIP